MTVRGYTAKKRLVTLKRLLALPVRTSAVRDASTHVTSIASSVWIRARAHSLPLLAGLFVLCTLVDAFGIVTRPLRTAERAPVPQTVVVASRVPASSSAPAQAAAHAAAQAAAPSRAVELVGPILPEEMDAHARQALRSPKSPSSAKVATVKKSVPLKPAAARKHVRGRMPAGILAEREVASVLRLAGIPRAHVNAMTCTARFESGFNPRATNKNPNGTRDTGLFQVNDVWLQACDVTRADLLDPIVNAKCARQILDKQGLKAWMAWQVRKRVCDGYKVGDFERKGLKTIRSIDAAHAVADRG